MKYVKLGNSGVEEAASAVDIVLSDDEIAALEAPYTAHTKQHAF